MRLEITDSGAHYADNMPTHRLCGNCQKQPLKAARDKAILLVGFAGAFRRSELVALRMEDITPHAHGIELLIRRSKTDQDGQGRTVFLPLAKSEERCPVKALQRWLELAGIGVGLCFVP